MTTKTKTSVLDSLFALEDLDPPATIPQQAPDQLLQDLQALRKTFAKEGSWGIGDWLASDGTMCMEGGIAKVSGFKEAGKDFAELSLIREGRSKLAKRSDALASAIEAAAGIGRDEIPDWNDMGWNRESVNWGAISKGMLKHQDIIDVIDKAIKTRAEELTLIQARGGIVG